MRKPSLVYGTTLFMALFPSAFSHGADAFAVVELFTSQGCSSCPPADRLLARIASEAERKSRPVFALSFHVDYWNDLGWEDPFSRPEFSQRQQRYARSLPARVYTPQMVVNGGREFVGSREDEAEKGIEAALAHPAAAAIALTSGYGEEGILRVSYRVSGHAPGDFLNIALVENGRSVSVKAGENRGRRLHHANVVRAFRAQALDGTGAGAARMDVPPELRGGGATLVAYVQEPESLRITGAARTAPPASPPGKRR